MAGSASHLVDRVLPSAPMRQYVLSFPYELSALAATRPEVFAKLCRVFWESVRARYRRWAKVAGYTKAETGSVSATLRFGSSLNLHAHIHSLVVDGVYAEEEGVLHFLPAPAPTREELAEMLSRVHSRVVKWLSRKGYIRDAEESNAPPELTPIEALASAGTQRGTLVAVRESEDADTADERASPGMHRDSDAVVHERFNLHAGVTLGADDDVGRERLCRYLMRPAFSLSRPWNS